MNCSCCGCGGGCGLIALLLVAAGVWKMLNHQKGRQLDV
jgi:hypothetical protein